LTFFQSFTHLPLEKLTRGNHYAGRHYIIEQLGERAVVELPPSPHLLHNWLQFRFVKNDHCVDSFFLVHPCPERYYTQREREWMTEGDR
jgi:hypothetical protein